MRVEFEMLGDVQFSRDLLKYGDRGADLSPAFGVIADDWVDWNQKQFDTEGFRGSGGWDGLAPSTVRTRGNAHPILQVTGALLRELTDKSNIEIQHNFMHLMIPDEQNEYGRFHQSGTSRMPRRRPIEFTDLDRKSMVKTIQRYLETGVAA